MNLDAIGDALPSFVEGLQVTAILLAASLALGLAAALPLAFARISPRDVVTPTTRSPSLRKPLTSQFSSMSTPRRSAPRA